MKNGHYLRINDEMRTFDPVLILNDRVHIIGYAGTVPLGNYRYVPIKTPKYKT